MNTVDKKKILTENKKLFLKTQQTTCVSNEPSDIGLSYTFADNDFTNKYVSSYSHINNGFKMEKCKMSGDNKLSDNWQKYQFPTFKKCAPQKGIMVDKKTEDLNYLKLSYQDGYIPICNVNVDSNLTRGNMENKPIDRFAEKVTGGRMSILPEKYIPAYDFKKIKVGGQNIGDPTKISLFYNKQGISTRDFQRKRAKFYKKCENNYQINGCNQLGFHGRHN